MSYLIWGVSVTRKNGNILWSTNVAEAGLPVLLATEAETAAAVSDSSLY